MRLPLFGLMAMLLLAACDYAVQTTSGEEYLSRYPAAGTEAATAASGDNALVLQAAAVEPILTFPARFGLARIEAGVLTAVPAGEAALWAGLAERRAGMGTFVPVNPLLAEFTAEALLAERPDRWHRSVGDIVRTIRLGAARQHLDAVLIYEVATSADRNATVLGFADLTIIGGAFLPTRSIEARALATALLLDVRNGYPYATASTEADLRQLSPSWGAGLRARAMRGKAALQVVGKLVPEAEAMLADLHAAMRARAAAAGS